MSDQTTPQSVRRRMAQEFVDHLDAGRAPWAMPWGSMPAVAQGAQGQPYAGLNRLNASLRMFELQAAGREADPRFMTEKVAQKLGAGLRAGAKPMTTEHVHARMFWEQPSVVVEHVMKTPSSNIKPFRRGESPSREPAEQVQAVDVLRLTDDGKVSVRWLTPTGGPREAELAMKDLRVKTPDGRSMGFAQAIADPMLNQVYTKGYEVYSASDFEGLEPMAPAARKPVSQSDAQHRVMQAFEGMVKRGGLQVIIGDRSYYSHQHDALGVRPLEAFESPAHYCETLLTGLALSCEHTSRVGKPSGAARSNEEIVLTAKLAMTDMARHFGFNPPASVDAGFVASVKKLALSDPDALARASLQADKISHHVFEQMRSLQVEQECRKHGVPYYYKDEKGRLHVDDFATGTNLLDPKDSIAKSFNAPARGVAQPYSGVVYDLALSRFAMANITPSATAMTYLDTQSAKEAAKQAREYAKAHAHAQTGSFQLDDRLPDLETDEAPGVDLAPQGELVSSDGAGWDQGLV